MFTKAFWLDAGERAIKTFVQAFLSVFAVSGVTILNLDWKEALALSATAALGSILTSIISAKAGGTETASLVREVSYDPHQNVGLE